jgi:PIN domain nuclease of toxin-antitoxin system
VIYLLDTHLLLWAADDSEKLSAAARKHIEDKSTGLMFSAATIWEVSVKSAKGRDDFSVDPRLLRRGLLDNGYTELPIESSHAAAVYDLPAHHADPFDRIQIAQARVEGLVLLTTDVLMARYGAPVELV